MMLPQLHQRDEKDDASREPGIALTTEARERIETFPNHIRMAPPRRGKARESAVEATGVVEGHESKEAA